MKRKTSDEQVKKLLEAYASGMSMTEAGKLAGLPSGQSSYWINKYGLSRDVNAKKNKCKKCVYHNTHNYCEFYLETGKHRTDDGNDCKDFVEGSDEIPYKPKPFKISPRKFEQLLYSQEIYNKEEWE